MNIKYILFFGLIYLGSLQTSVGKYNLIRPNPVKAKSDVVKNRVRPLGVLQQEFLYLRFGMFIHFNIPTYGGDDWPDPQLSPEVFNPVKLDCNHWAYPYKVVKFGKGEIDPGKDKITFKQDLNTDFGYGYLYNKQLILSENSPEITVKHTLTNTGQKNIQTNPYCHNFMHFDDDFIGENYKIAFSNPIRAIHNFGSKATFSDKSFRLNYNLTDDKPVEGSINANQSNVFTLSDNKTGTFVTVSSDVVPDSFYLYTWRMAFCPEPMIQIDINPGESFTWNTTYKFGKQTKEN